MKKYLVLMLVSTIVGIVLLPLVPRVWLVPVYVLALLGGLLASIGLQVDALRYGRARRELKDRGPADDPVVTIPKHA